MSWGQGRAASERILGYRETQILRLVTADLVERGRVRSYDEIAKTLGMCGRNGVCNVVRRLEMRGLVQRVGQGRSRRIDVPLSENFTKQTRVRKSAPVNL